jgi:hypothetical protein
MTLAVIAGVVAVSCGSSANRTASSEPKTPLEVIETSGAGDRAASMSSESPGYGRRTYVAAADLGALPTEARAWRFDPAAVDVEQVRALARAFGIEGEPVALTDDKGGGWEVGTNPAPLLRVTADAMANWYVTTSSIEPSGCVVAEESRAVAGSASDDPTASDAPGAPDPADVPHAPVAADGVASCTPSPAAVDLLDTDGALAAARQRITASGFDPDDFTMTATVDAWAATVNATREIDGLNTDITWSMTFGSHGALVRASGSLTDPAPAADYPLVDLAAALERLNDAPVALLAPAGCGQVGAPEKTDISVACPEPTTMTVTSVQLSLSSVWTGDGRVWLAPSFRFRTEAGDEVSVVAVTDEYFRQIDGAATSDPAQPGGSTGSGSSGGGSTGGGSVEPAPPLEPPKDGVVTVSPEEAQALVGLAEDEAAKVAAERGWVVRVTVRDGEAFAVTEDYRLDRVNFTIESGVVAAVTVG